MHFYSTTNRQDVMCTCDLVLAEIFGCKAGAAIIRSLKRVDDTEHMLALLAPYTTHTVGFSFPFAINIPDIIIAIITTVIFVLICICF